MTLKNLEVEFDPDPLLTLARTANWCVRYQRMRELLPSILTARAANVPHKVIIRILKTEYGLEIDPGTYSTYLHRLKSETDSPTALPHHRSFENPALHATLSRPETPASPAQPPITTRVTAGNPDTKPPGVTPAEWAAMQAAARRSKKR